MRTIVTALMLVMLGTGIGCDAGKADVSGKVTHQGKTVVSGSVLMVGPDGVMVTGGISADGSYTVQGVTAGTVQIGVTSPKLVDRGRPVAISRVNDKDKDAPQADPKKWFPIPPQYAEPTTSGISKSIGKGTQKVDIELP